MAKTGDIIAKADVDLNAFDAGIDRMIAKLGKVEAQGKKTNKTIEAFGKKVQWGAIAAAAGQFATNLAEGGIQASDLAKSMYEISDANKQAFSNAGMGSLEKLKTGLIGILGAADGAIASLPIIGQAWGVATAGFKAYTDNLKDFRNIGVEINSQAEGMDQALAKLGRLTALRQNEREKVLHNKFHPEKAAYIEKELGEARARAVDKYVEAANEEIKAGQKLEAGDEKRVALSKLKIASAAKLAAIQESQKNSFGGMDDEGVRVVNKATELEAQNLRLQTRGLEISIAQEESEVALNDLASKRGITIEDQFNAERAIQNELTKQIDLATKLYGPNSVVTTGLKKQRRDSELHYAEIENGINKELHAARLTIEAEEARMAGNKKLAAIAQVRAKYEVQIAAALRDGKNDLAAQLQKIQALNILDAKAVDARKTPAQRKAELNEQRAQDKAIRKVNAQEKQRAAAEARGAWGYRSARPGVSPAAERARQEMMKRAAGENAKQQAGLKAGTINATELVVTSVRHK